MAGPKQKRVLAIDDDSTMCLILQNRLQTWGYQVAVASNGREGFEKVKDGSFDLVICDVMLPDQDGFSLCQQARKAGVKTPWLFLTGKTQADATVLGFKVGADDYLSKPFDVQELRMRVENLLRRGSA